MSVSQETPKEALVAPCDIKDVLSYFAKESYAPHGEHEFGQSSMNRCIELMKADYNTLLISNSAGELSPTYPAQLIILEHELQVPPQSATNPQYRTTNTIYESLYDVNKLRELINKARFARCRMRFPLPVILYKGKYICRSATLSGGAEIYGRAGLDYLFYGTESVCDNVENNSGSEEGTSSEANTPVSDWQLFDKVRSQDIKLLKTLNVGTIVDFMVEKKKVKYGLNVTSSEKVDKVNRYADFSLISLPYPGCEFFRDYKDNNYVGEGLIFDWNQTYVDATVHIPEDHANFNAAGQQNPTIDWANYKRWDLVQITQNYMKVLLRCLQEQSSGLLIHCISGWDRTPLFVSLVRVSLWADGMVHQSLDANEILYLTITYDWMLFGHRLTERLDKGEEIFFFCFYMLKHLVSEDFSALPNRLKTKNSSGGLSSASSAAPKGSDSPVNSTSSSNTSPPHPVETAPKNVVARTDSDLQLDGGVLILENDPRGSNISLNSTCSSISNKSLSQEPITAVWFQPGVDETLYANGVFCSNMVGLSQSTYENGNNGNLTPPHGNGNGNGNSSDGSASSVTSGSVSSAMSACTATGLNRSPQTRRTSPVSVPATSRLRKAQDSPSNLSIGSWQMITGTGSLRSSSSDNGSTTLNDDDGAAAHADAYATRKERLLKVREIFYLCYHATIGFKFKNDPTYSALFNTMAENIAGNFGFSAARD